MPDAVDAVVGEFSVGTEVHVVRCVDRQVDIEPLRHLVGPEEVPVGLRNARGHVDEVVVLFDRLVRVDDERIVPEDLQHESFLDVFESHTDLLVVRRSDVGAGPNHLDLQSAEAQVMYILDTVLERAPFT